MESPRHCLNCAAPLPDGGHYCPECGQKDSPSRVPAREILGEFFSTVLSWDHRLWQTLRVILRPGQLTRVYFQGKRASYIAPARLFLFAVLLHLAVINFFLSPDLFKSEDTQRIGRELVDLDHTIRELRDWRGKLAEERPADPGQLEAADSLLRTLEDRFRVMHDKRTISINLPLVSDQTLVLPIFELETGDPDSLCRRHGIHSVTGRVFIHQLLKAYRHPRNFGNFVVARLSWMIFLLVPLMALVLFGLYWRRPYYYIEHLIFTMHVHVVAFLAVSLGLILDAWLDQSLTGWFFLASLVYTLLALKRYYGQGWWRTGLKFTLYHFAYFWAGLCTGLLLLLVGFLLFSA